VQAAERIVVRRDYQDLGRRTPISSWLFSSAFRDFTKRRRRGASASTISARLYIEPYLGEVVVSKLKPAHLSDLYQRLLTSGRRGGKAGISPKTLRLVHGVMCAALRWAVNMQLVSRNVATAVDLPRIKRSEAKGIFR
jgi:hypothetical protein